MNYDEFPYHFGFDEWERAGFRPFEHDYKPVHGPMPMPFAPDIPERLYHVKGVSIRPGEAIDPYLPIAELRLLFESRGRKLAGFLIGAEVVNPTTDHTGSLDNLPPNKHLIAVTTAAGCNPYLLIKKCGVHPLALLHLEFYMAFFERRYQFARMRFKLENKAKQGNRDSMAKLERMLDPKLGMSLYQWRREVADSVIDYDAPQAVIRQLLMPPGMVHLPEDAVLDWSAIELGIKHVLEDKKTRGDGIACTDLIVAACDTEGAVAIMGARDGVINALGLVHWTTDILFRDLLYIFAWIADGEFGQFREGHDGWNRLNELMLRAYGFDVMEWMAFDVPDKFWNLLDDTSREWLRECKPRCKRLWAEHLRKNGLPEDYHFGISVEVTRNQRH